MNEVSLKDFSFPSLLAFGIGGLFELLMDTPKHVAYTFCLFNRVSD